MNVLSFAEEFTRLVLRYTKNPSPNNDPSEDAFVPLTHQEITNTVRNVVQTILHTDDDYYDSFSIKTPASGIAVITPAAPTVPRISHVKDAREEAEEDASRSQSSSTATTNIVCPSSLLRNCDEEAKNSPDLLQSEKKFISRSSPAICVSGVARSDTFVREQNEPGPSNELDPFDDIATNEVTDSFIRSLNEIRESAMRVVDKMDFLKKQALSDSARHMRRLSSNEPSRASIGRPSGPIKIRRSATAIPGTPTSSRSLTVGKENTSDKHKSSSVGSASTQKLGESSAMSRSISSLNLSVSNKSQSSATKAAKNPKYAHVQSTIPKPIAIKRKAQ